MSATPGRHSGLKFDADYQFFARRRRRRRRPSNRVLQFFCGVSQRDSVKDWRS